MSVFVATKRAQNALEATGQMLKWPGVCLTITFCSYLEELALNSIMPAVIFSADPPLMRRVRD